MMDLIDIAKSPLVPLLTFFLGLILGHRLNINRDRRIEFNAIADRMHALLLKQLDAPAPHHHFPDPVDVALLSDMLDPWRRHGFRHAIERYKEARQKHLTQDPDYGSDQYTETAHIQAAIKDLLRYLKRQ